MAPENSPSLLLFCSTRNKNKLSTFDKLFVCLFVFFPNEIHAALDLIKNVEVQAIIGPQSSMQANFIIDLGVKAHVPIISFSATSPSLSSLRSPYFFRATQNDSSQVKAISAIVKAFGWREAVPIYVDNEYGEGILPCLTDTLQKIDTRVPYRSVIPPSATDDQIGQELYKLMTMQTRVFIVHMLPNLGSRFFSKAKEVGMMSEGYVWIVTNGIGNHLSLMNLSVIDSMQGVLVVENYVPQTKELEDFSIRWKKKFYQANRTINLNAKANIYGLWAHDAALALAMAIEKVGATNFGFQKTNTSGNSTDLSTFGASQIGLKISQALSNTAFQGLAGDFHLVDGQLPPSAFQIENVIGQGGREIGFWTPQDGIIRKLKTTNTGMYSTSKANLGAIIWPSETVSVPKGWVIPTNGKKLKIGVPKKNGFFEFVNVTRDLSTNTTSVTGYCIDVFNVVMKALPYHVPYEFIPFEKRDGESAGSYDDLIYQVYLQVS